MTDENGLGREGSDSNNGIARRPNPFHPGCTMRRVILLVIIVLLAGGALGAWYLRAASRPAVSFRTEPVTRGELVATVSATGTLEPEEVIDVGAQVAGMIKEFGTGTDGKPIDYGSTVDAGTVLARIDDSLYKAKVEQS